MYDIVIIGAGPAGSTLARLLSNKYKVLLVDQRNLDKQSDFVKEKCCGGLLAPAAQKELAKQGVGVPVNILTSPQTFSVKSVDMDNRLIRFYQRHYINIDREKFDWWLVSLVPDSVERKFSHIYKSYEATDNGYIVSLEINKKKLIIETRILIGADGAVSRVRSQAFAGCSIPDKYISIQEWFLSDIGRPYYISIFNKDTTDFYSWIIQKQDKILVGTAIPFKENADARYRALIGKLRESGYIQGDAVKKTGTLIMRPRKIHQLNIHRDNIAMIGEAAGFISPSSAEGISYALESGKILSSAINDGIEGFSTRYERK
ncbi:MAG: FAD-binding protein, partial [Clostridiales bacterium]|nr:FAD-binding protein [Clostridiales bacterium]